MNIDELAKRFWQAKPGKGAYVGKSSLGFPRYRDEVRVDGDYVVWIHWSTEIVVWDRKENILTLDDGGWWTISTKTRLNNILWYGPTGFVYSEGKKKLISIKGIRMFWKPPMKFYLDDLRRGHEANIKSYQLWERKRERIRNRLWSRALRGLPSRVLEDLGVKIVSSESPWDRSEWIRDLGTLVIPAKSKVIVQQGFQDLRGNVVLKLLICKPYERVDDVALLGKDSTGLWLHWLPPFYWLANIITCEKWVIGIPEDGILVDYS